MTQIKTLQKLGFTEYEARAYISLAKLGPSTVKEIVEESKLPRNKTYESLQKLEEKNRIISLPLSPKKFKITDPENLKNEADKIISSVKEIIETIKQPKSKEYKDMFWVIKSQKAITDKMASEMAKAQQEILGSATFSKPFYRNIRELQKAIKRGVKVKFISTFKKERIPVYKEYINIGVEMRIFNEKKFGPLMPRTGIYDKSKARLTIGNPEIKNQDDYITIWSESKTFSNTIRNQFFHMWQHAKPIEKYLEEHSKKLNLNKTPS